MLRVGGLICRVKAFVAVLLALSFTLTWKLNVPVAVGLPLIVPVAALRLSPEGNALLLRDQVYGGFPPLATNVWEYCAPTDPLGSCGPVLMLSAGALIFRVRDFAAVTEALSLTWTSKFRVPAVVGIPLIVPAAALRVRPEGRVPSVTVQLYGGVPPLAANVWEYCTPVVPSGSCEPVLMLSAGALIVRLKSLVVAAAALSLTFTVKLYVPPVAGVPVSVPVLGSSNRPAGKVPEATDQV